MNSKLSRVNTIFIRISLDDKILFTKNLALALRSGVSLVNSLKLVQNQAKTKSFKKILESLMDDANKGVFLSAGLAKFGSVFGPLFVNVIRVAETSGTLPENLLYLGNELVKKSQLRKKIKGALIYPIIILLATVVIGASMVVFVFPKIVPLFENANVELPFTTRMLIWLSDFLTQFGIFAAVGAVIIWILFRVLLHVRPIKYFYDSTLFYAPIFGKAVVNFNMANFTRTLGLLLKSGVPITEAIDITAETLTNSVYRRRLKTASDQVRKGEFLSRYLYKKSREFPTTLVNMLEVGENTGNLTENLKYLDEYYDNEVDAFTKNLSSILEPLLLLVMGGVVAFIALSFITPIYQVTRTIQ